MTISNPRKSFVSFLLFVVSFLVLPGSLFGQCDIGRCPDNPPVIVQPPVIISQPPVSISPGVQFGNGVAVGSLNFQSDNPLVRSSRGPSDRVAMRVSTGGGCGSGSVCGSMDGGRLVLTNAHVVGTRVGRVVDLNAEVDGRMQRGSGRVVVAAYSDRTLTDWAVCFTTDFNNIEPVALSKDRPRGSHYTKGSPRCVWPLVSTDITTVDMAQNSPLWRWRPNSIGGQSGSGVWSDDDNLQYGLLTWSWGGLGAGQMTSEIYRQSRDRTTDGVERVKGLVPVFCEMPQEKSFICSDANPVIVENGFFAQADIDRLPIWDGDAPADPDSPQGNELDVINAKLRRFEIDPEKFWKMMLSSDCNAQHFDDFVDAKAKCEKLGFDFGRLIELILEIVRLFQS